MQDGTCGSKSAQLKPAILYNSKYQTCAGKLSDPVKSGFPGEVTENWTGEAKLTGARLGKFCLTDIQLIRLKFK